MRRQKRAALQGLPQGNSGAAEQNGTAAELEAALGKALHRARQLKKQLEAARSEAWLKNLNDMLAGLGSADRPNTAVQEAAAKPPPSEPGGRTTIKATDAKTKAERIAERTTEAGDEGGPFPETGRRRQKRRTGLTVGRRGAG